MVFYKLVWQRSRVRIPYKPEFFSGFLFATAKFATINAMMSKVGRIVVVVSCVLWRRVFFIATFFDVESIPSFTTPFYFFILISSHFKGLKFKNFPDSMPLDHPR